MTEVFEKAYKDYHLDLLNEDEVNEIIKANKLDTNKISDGYHTFEQLYEHRIILFLRLCFHVNIYNDGEIPVWRSKKHSDGTEWDGWFLLGIGIEKGEQITYHLPIKYLEDCNWAEDLDQAPQFDGHTSEDVLNRLKQL